MDTIDLCGKWEVRQSLTDEAFEASVPGCVHTDLLDAGKIPDPFFGENESDLQWIGEARWAYRRRFTVSSDFLRHDSLILRCEGLDTFASLAVNNRSIGRTGNMFRRYEFDLKDHLQEGENRIDIVFDSPLRFIEKRNKKRKIPNWHGHDGRNWVRKEPCNFGWDWGPKLVTCGIWRKIEILAFDKARLSDLRISQDHSPRGAVDLRVDIQSEKVRRGCPLLTAISLRHKGRLVASETASFRGKNARAHLLVRRPKLWWPSGMGEQPLYEICVELLDADGRVLDKSTKRLGLRTLELRREKDPWGESFEFVANGIPFFAKGANWIPADVFAPRLIDSEYSLLLKAATNAHMNMLRVWGGGIYESDVFYDLCDKRGICVWQDFMFSCATYPAFDEDFMKSVQAEARDNVRRLRHHPSIALWCGNNEIEQGLAREKWTECSMSWEDYSKLFDKLLPQVVRALDPQRDYWPGSPHSPRGNRSDWNNPACGDAHLWEVWHGRKPFEWYRTSEHRFCSEFGFQSFPEPKTVETFTNPSDRNITSPVMEHHQRSPIGNTLIMTYMLDWFRAPKNFDMTLRLSQILQAEGMKYAVEHWRRNMPRTMGTLYWQLNDCWPVASWSSIDSSYHLKALHHAARRFYAPLLISGLENPKEGSVEIHVTSDLAKSAKGEVSYLLTAAAGKTLDSGSKRVRLPARKNTKVQTLSLASHLEKHGPRDLMLWLELKTDEETVSTNLVTFAKPKQIELRDPKISIRVEAEKPKKNKWKTRGYFVHLRAKSPALWVWLDIEGCDLASDNYFHLVPGKPRKIPVVPTKDLTLKAFRESLTVHSLMDTYE